MGKVTLDPLQEKIFHLFISSPLSRAFYFTGGTALSAFYFHHRVSEDLDFFAQEDFDNAPVYDFLNLLSKHLNVPYKFTQRYKARICEFTKKGKPIMKIDFVHHPYSRIERGISYRGFSIDSLRDIGTNKLLCVNQRTDIKDYVDLYYLLKKFTLWDLIYGVEAKYRMKMDLILIAADFMKVEELPTLPKMIKPLTLAVLVRFFRAKAKEIAGTVVTK